jgi:hypothetical protein
MTKKTKKQLPLALPQIRHELKALLKECADPHSTMHGVLTAHQLESLQFACDRLKLTRTCGLCGKYLEN